MLVGNRILPVIRKLGACRRRVCSIHRVLEAQRFNFLQIARCSTNVLESPYVEGTVKQYAPKLQKIVEDISQLTLLEVADLNELLKKTLNIQDVPAMMAAAPLAAPQEEEEVEPKQEKTSFTVKLLKFEASKKVTLIKEIKSLISGMNLVQAKKFVESAPQVVRSDIGKDEAEKLKDALMAVGAEVEIE